MLVRCDVCGVEAAAVLCCADEAALCSGCDGRVHRANKLADKHRRVPLVHPSSAAAPLCDVCKERRGLVFCVEDRAILCADCDDPIHSANHLTANHTRFLLVGAKLSAAAPVDDDDSPPPSPHHHRSPSEEPHRLAAAAVCAHQTPAPPLQYGSGGKGSSISDYLTNICPGFRVDDLLFDDDAFSAATEATRCDDEQEQVPSLNADLFDVVAGRPAKKRGGAWYGGVLGMDKQAAPAAAAAAASIAVPTAAAAKQQNHQAERERHWNCDSDNDLFAVPEISPPAKKARPPPPSFWCF